MVPSIVKGQMSDKYPPELEKEIECNVTVTLHCNAKLLHCNMHVTSCNTEKEKEKEYIYLSK